MKRFYKSNTIPNEEMSSLIVLQNPTDGEKVKACLLMLLKIISLGILAIPEFTTSNKKNKEQVKALDKVINNMKNPKSSKKPYSVFRQFS